MFNLVQSISDTYGHKYGAYHNGIINNMNQQYK
jgi:hypothetical protein